MTGQPPTRIRVAVVDDQPLERAGNALILDSDDEIEVVGEAGNGVEAISIVSDTLPGIVLMDIRMPVMNGLEATRIIAETHPATRVIVLTTFDLDEYAFGSLKAGASAFLLKSTKPASLIDAVKTVASGSAVVSPRLTAKLIEHYLRPASPLKQNHGAMGERSGRLDVLSPRERDIFTAIIRGLTNSEISTELVLASSTVKSHINSIFAKLGLRDRVHAVLLGHELGLVGQHSDPEAGADSRA
ncbi:response regulator [Microbacterium murale]|uniref:DNA-binding NarL/FixJ family response regulator n=1 Tax=Microbacterium murale TaxID=1081040 RepID=A0ABU0PDG2_9MICO|nr:response regulator transcription factor [Microbacterium murale]MDQ0645355.1 DNA-binding NarL/FixJ family response regulator [Microbacterium murale]